MTMPATTIAASTQEKLLRARAASAKLALLSFDATLRSNLSCGMPIDILRYETDSFNASNLAMLKEDDTYWNTLRNGYGEGLSGLVKMLPPPPNWNS